MEQIEIILRTTTPSGKVTEQLLAKFDTEKPVIESDKVLQYSGLHIDPDKHQVSYQGSVLPLTETYEFQTFCLSLQSARKSLYQRADLSGSLEGGTGGCEQCGILYHQEYPPEAAEGYSKRIHPDGVGSRIQICGCPRGVNPWDISSGKIIKTAKIEKIAEFLILILVEG